MRTSIDGLDADEREALPAGTQLGVWRIDATIGSGGMATVYRAERSDGLFDQTVAIKVLPPGDAPRAMRFEAERRRLASLNHPGICRIIDGGSEIGPGGEQTPWMAMEFVDGKPIDAFADEQSLSVRARLLLINELCAALSHAHDRLIAHRDLKPDNVLVDGSSRVRLIDFGIAGLIDEEDNSQRGTLTAAYAAPEQIGLAEQGVSTDVFGLGMLLHRLLIGSLPPRRPDHGVKVSPSAFDNAERAAITQRALATDPADRYPSIEALQADINASLRHRPVSAMGDGAIYRARKFLTRYPIQSLLGASLFVALSAGLLVSLAAQREAQAQAEIAQEELARAEFFLLSSDTALEISNTYQDLMQRTFGTAEEQQRLNDSLMARWREAHSRREEEPHKAALLSYSIGRHFLFRNDFTRAVEILEPWVEQGYGHPRIRTLGKVLLPIAYTNLGNTDKAIPLLRETEATFANSYEALSPDHVAIAGRLASNTRDADDIERALALLSAAMDEQTHPELLTYFWNMVSSMERLRGDLKAAHDAAREVVNVMESSRLNTIAGRDVARMNLASFELDLDGDRVLARRLAEAVMAGEIAASRVNREYGRAMALIAMLDHFEGRSDGVPERLAEAASIIKRFAGVGSPHYTDTMAARAEVLADLGLSEQASQAIAELKAELADQTLRRSSGYMLILTEAYVTKAAPKEAIDAQVIRTSSTLTALVERLRHRGVLDDSVEGFAD